MTTAFKNKSAALIGMLMAMTAQLNAVDCGQSTCCDDRCREIGFRAELLYWRPELCGIESAFGDTTIATGINQSGIVTTTITESNHEPHAKWSPGFRLGVDLPLYCFDAELDWTHFYGSSSFHDGAQYGKWSIHYDAIDLTFGQRFWVSNCFYLKPFIGVRGLVIHQTLNSHLHTLVTSSIAGDSTIVTNMNDKEDFWGVGPQIGLLGDWNIGCNFSVYGSVAVVSYYGNVEGKHFDVDTFPTTVSVCNGTGDRCFSTIGTDAAIGVRWDSCPICFCGCEVNFMAKIGLEQHRIYDFSDLGSDGTLSLDGAVFGIGLSSNY